MAEVLPITTFLNQLDGGSPSNWNTSNVVKPAFIEVNGTNEPFRFDLNVGDQVIGSAGSPALEEPPIGNWKYGNRTYNIELTLYTNGRYNFPFSKKCILDGGKSSNSSAR